MKRKADLPYEIFSTLFNTESPVAGLQFAVFKFSVSLIFIRNVIHNKT